MSNLNRSSAQSLLQQYIQSVSLQHHCEMVAQAMAAYAVKLKQDKEIWYITGLLHDLDWEMFPDEHPRQAINEILPAAGASAEIIGAIAAHAPQRTGKQPQTLLEHHLFACDEICGFLDAVIKIRPNGFADLKWSSVNKKLKDKRFAANVSRDDIRQGAQLIETPLADHVDFLIEIFKS